MVLVTHSNRTLIKLSKISINWEERFLSQIEKHISNVNLIYFVDGEPLLIKSHFKLLKRCTEKKYCKKINLKYSSNITYISDSILELWKHFKSVKVHASIDGYRKINNLIRFLNLWPQIEKNIQKLDSTTE